MLGKVKVSAREVEQEKAELLLSGEVEQEERSKGDQYIISKQVNEQVNKYVHK